MQQLKLQALNGIQPQKSAESFTLSQQKEQLENLLYQKVQKGEDISRILEALNYLTSRDIRENQLQKIWDEVAKERSAFNSLQRVAITAFAILGMIAFFNGAFGRAKPSPAVLNPPPVQSH